MALAEQPTERYGVPPPVSGSVGPRRMNMKVTPVAIAVLVLSSFLMAHAQATQWSHGWSKAFMSEKYSQRISSSQNTAYPKKEVGHACSSRLIMNRESMGGGDGSSGNQGADQAI